MNYCENMQKSIDYIEENIKEDIDISTAIMQSGYSITHFYRIFQAILGESIKDYIIKRKLSDAAVELASTKKRLIEVAIDYGFHSQEVFTRAFTKIFHISPGRYRKLNHGIVLHEKVNVSQKVMEKNEGSLEYKIVLEKKFKVIGLEKTVTPGGAEIRGLWDEFNLRKSEVSNIVSHSNVLGICEYMPTITDESAFEYFAGVEVADLAAVPEGMLTKTIPHSKYVIFTHRGTMEELKATYNNIYGRWLPLSNHQLAERDTIEIYTIDHNQDHILNIYIPLKV